MKLPGSVGISPLAAIPGIPTGEVDKILKEFIPLHMQKRALDVKATRGANRFIYFGLCITFK